jgi:hypothetical protein
MKNFRKKKTKTFMTQVKIQIKNNNKKLIKLHKIKIKISYRLIKI